MINAKRFGTLALVALLVAATGCTAVARKLGSLTDNKYAEPRSGSVWVVAPPQLEPPAADKRVVYISYRNISDADIDLTDTIKQAAVQQGWRLTTDPQKATYRLRSSLRFFGEVEPESGGAGVGRSMGTVAGAAVGIGTGVAVANLTDSGWAGAAAGIGAGGLVAEGISNASRPREWALILDVVLEELGNKPVTFQMATAKQSGTLDVSGASSGQTSSAGGEVSVNTTGGTTTKTSRYFPHGIRLSVWANQMNMQEEEALPHIYKRAERVVKQMLPQ